jgi:hypothetical protein
MSFSIAIVAFEQSNDAAGRAPLTARREIKLTTRMAASLMDVDIAETAGALRFASTQYARFGHHGLDLTRRGTLSTTIFSRSARWMGYKVSKSFANASTAT